VTPIHGACIIAALAMPVLCGFSHTCIESLKEVIGLSGLVIAAVMGNASSARRRRRTKPDRQGDRP
jgi:hypothetical protein